jgi:hypothetical protein
MRALLLLAALLSAPTVSAQIGIGGQVGDPTGLSIKAGAGRGAITIAAGWDLNDSVTAEAHYLLRDRRARGAASDVRVYYGPGIYVRDSDRRDTEFGVSLGHGHGQIVGPEIEGYGLVSPRLQLIDETDFDIGGGIGLRLYL